MEESPLFAIEQPKITIVPSLKKHDNDMASYPEYGVAQCQYMKCNDY